MASAEIRDRRRTLRYRGLLVRQMVQMKNRVSGLLLEKDVTHSLRSVDDLPCLVVPLLDAVARFAEVENNPDRSEERRVGKECA